MSKTTTVDAVDPLKKTSKVIDSAGNEVTVQMTDTEAKCYWNDAEFSAGAEIDANGKRYECSFGYWVEVSDE